MSDAQLFAVPSAGPDMEVVAELERLLDEAREGRIRALVAFYDAGPHVSQTIVGKYDNFEKKKKVHRLAHRMQVNMDGAKAPEGGVS